MVGLAQMVRASDCGPEGRRFDPDIPPHTFFPVAHIELETIKNTTIRGCSTAVSMQVFQT